MSEDARHERSAWGSAMSAAALFAVDPMGAGGVLVRSMPGPVRDRWQDVCGKLFPDGTRFARLPVQVSEDRLLGGLDLAATLEQGRSIGGTGLLAELDGHVAVLAMAERMKRVTCAHITAAMDTGVHQLERDGVSRRAPARFGVIALDEGLDADERAPEALRDRLAFHIDLSAVPWRDTGEAGFDAAAISSARARLASVTVDGGIVDALVRAAASLGIGSVRAIMLALSAARAAAALDGRKTVGEADAVLAGRLVLAPRARALPENREDDDQSPPPEPDAHDDDDTGQDKSEHAPPDSDTENNDDLSTPDEIPLEDLILAATEAALPRDLLDAAPSPPNGGTQRRTSGTAGAVAKSGLRGRPVGVRRGAPGAGARLSVIETLRAAAPWQRVRRMSAIEGSTASSKSRRVHVRKDDFRIIRYAERSETATIFVVDASGSTALNRLAEAKGAVELLLADCYIRRDHVALIAMRGRAAEVVLPPTRSLARAKRCLAGLPGGGGTPMATGIEQAIGLAEAARRKGHEPTIVMLTDGAANVARDGTGGRAKAKSDAIAAARQVAGAGLKTIFIDAAPRASEFAAELARAMNAHYHALPRADAASVSKAVRSS